MTIFKGDPCWGPRYLTPIFAILWIFAPAEAVRCVGGWVVTLLALGLVVQLGTLSVDPHRLYVEPGCPRRSTCRPWLYFHPAISHLANRPREIAEILDAGGERAERSPSPSPLSHSRCSTSSRRGGGDPQVSCPQLVPPVVDRPAVPDRREAGRPGDGRLCCSSCWRRSGWRCNNARSSSAPKTDRKSEIKWRLPRAGIDEEGLG